MKNLVFLYDILLDGKYRRETQLPLTFISYAFINAKMYHYYEHRYGPIRSNLIAVENDAVSRRWGNDKVFGGIFLLDYFNVTIRDLDGLYSCSKSRINKNNRNDLMHRKVIETTPIQFKSLDELSRHKYKRLEIIKTHAYLGNPFHRWISHRIKMERYRVIDGVDKKHFKMLFEQEGGESN